MNQVNNLPNLITAKQLKEYLGCNNKKVYELCRRRDFPSFRLGKTYYIDADKLNEWITKESRKNKTEINY